MKTLHLFIALMMGITSLAQASEKLCVPVKSSGEGHWPIPEKAFSKENALTGLKELDALLEEKENYIEEDMHNAFVMIEGYILKKHISELKAENSDQVNHATRDFCYFLKNKAYISH